MEVKLVSTTQSLVEGINSPEDIIVYNARVSNPNNQLNTETGGKLINYCIKNKHWSIFEQADLCVEVKTSRAIAAQILRHKSFSFQEFCLSGDSLIALSDKDGITSKWRTIKRLYDNSINKPNARLPKVKVFDTNQRVFITSRINKIFKTGIKPVYEVTLWDNKKIKATKDHKFLDINLNFTTLEDIIGLDTKHHTMSKVAFIGCNGIPLYRDKELLRKAKEESIVNGLGINYIASKLEGNYNTIRTWLRKYELGFTTKEKASVRKVWNKGKFGYKNNYICSEEVKEKIRQARSGPKSNWWKGGVERTERQKIKDFCQKVKPFKLKEFNYKCRICGSKDKLELDHIIPVYSSIELAYSLDNLQILCKQCHCKKHNINQDHKIFREKNPKGKKTVKFVKVKSIRFVGNEETYDLEVESDYHNYIANKFIVHNSQRYAECSEFEPISIRLQGKTNRQVGDEEIVNEDIDYRISKHVKESYSLYKDLVSSGVAKECARMVLPLNTQTTMYMKGSVRSWIHYFDVRCSEHTQKEHRDLAFKIREEFSKIFPVISTALGYI